MHRELALKEKELEEKHERLLKELEMRHASLPPRSDFDVVSHIKQIPPFHEKYVERYFPQFERVAVKMACTARKILRRLWQLSSIPGPVRSPLQASACSVPKQSCQGSIHCDSFNRQGLEPGLPQNGQETPQCANHCHCLLIH